MPEPLNRRQAVGLGAVVVTGWAVGQMLRRTAPIGRDVGPTADLILAGSGSPEYGPANATLRLAVFTDYRCPACRHAFPALEEAVRRDRKVRVIYKDWPIFGPPSERAASVALACAEQGIYLKVSIAFQFCAIGVFCPKVMIFVKRTCATVGLRKLIVRIEIETKPLSP